MFIQNDSRFVAGVSFPVMFHLKWPLQALNHFCCAWSIPILDPLDFDCKKSWCLGTGHSVIALECNSLGRTIWLLQGCALWYKEVTVKPKHTFFFLSVVWERKTSILFRISLRPVAPTTLVLVCSFFMFFTQWLCIRVVLEIFSLSPLLLATEMWLAARVGGGGKLGGINNPVCSCALACFFSPDHRNNVIWFSSHCWHSSPRPPLPLHSHSYTCCSTIHHACAFIACVPGSVLNQLYQWAGNKYRFNVNVQDWPYKL